VRACQYRTFHGARETVDFFFILFFFDSRSTRARLALDDVFGLYWHNTRRPLVVPKQPAAPAASS
jgi:hypothetical protein